MQVFWCFIHHGDRDWGQNLNGFLWFGGKLSSLANCVDKSERSERGKKKTRQRRRMADLMDCETALTSLSGI